MDCEDGVGGVGRGGEVGEMAAEEDATVVNGCGEREGVDV